MEAIGVEFARAGVPHMGLGARVPWRARATCVRGACRQGTPDVEQVVEERVYGVTIHIAHRLAAALFGQAASRALGRVVGGTRDGLRQTTR